jgi:hypothetical protein
MPCKAGPAEERKDRAERVAGLSEAFFQRPAPFLLRDYIDWSVVS